MSKIISTLFPPKLLLRPRSPSNASISSSRSPTPSTSTPPTPELPNISPRSSEVIQQPIVLELIPRIVDYLDARDILNLSATSRQCRDLRTSLTFRRHLEVNGWDVDALVRRAEMATNSKGRPWMHLARSALDKGDIATQYAQLPKEGGKKGERVSSKDRRAAQRFFRTLVDVATEHDHRNFETLASLAVAQGLSLIRFVSNVWAHDWKTRYRKTFVIAALINSQPPQLDVESDLEALAETFEFDNPKPPLSFVAARANFLYSYGCTSSTIEVASIHTPVSSTAYDPPHVATSHGTTFPGVRHALDRFKQRVAVDGFYRKAGGAVTSLRMTFEPRGLASRSKLPFTDKDQLALTATVTDGDNEPWVIDGTFNCKMGVGNFKNPTGGMSYELWVTPWGLAGEKIRGEGKHLGYFVLHWTKD